MSWSITILGKKVQVSSAVLPVDELLFLEDNPRVYAVTHGSVDGFDDLTEEEQQQLIFEKLSDEPSVKKLIPEIQRHGGLIEPILIRYDTKQVIEGNSRLAAYRLLQCQDSAGQGTWDEIPCHMVSQLSDEQQAALLNQIHVKGKTNWSAYEKANFAFVRYKRGWTYQAIADLFGESLGTIRTRVSVVRLMQKSEDDDQRRFSYYDVLVRTRTIWNEVSNEDSPLRQAVITQIKRINPDRDQEFTAQELRKKLPAVMKKPKILRRYQRGDVDLDEAYERAKVSHVEQRVKQALAQIEAVEKRDVSNLDQNAVNALRQAVRKLARGVKRVSGLVDSWKAPV